MADMAKKSKLKGFSFITCNFERTSPPLDQRMSVVKDKAETKLLNFEVTFEEALKLSLGIEDCLRWINAQNRSMTEGKRAALGITFHLPKEPGEEGRITVYRAKLPSKAGKRRARGPTGRRSAPEPGKGPRIAP